MIIRSPWRLQTRTRCDTSLVVCVLLHDVLEVGEGGQELLLHDGDGDDRDLVRDQVSGEPHKDGETFQVEQGMGREGR